MKSGDSSVFTAAGDLVALPLPGKKRPLDGFWRHDRRLRKAVLVFVHGMGSNFYRSRLRKEILRQGAGFGFDALLFNNRGAEQGTIDERFADCLQDIDAALRFARSCGYRRIVLAGHSTGCQKIAYYQSRRAPADVRALALLSPADDHALCRRDLGKRFDREVARARRMIRTGCGKDMVSGLYETFSARRFLSIADPKQTEAGLFDYTGPLKHFSRIRIPILAVFGTREEFAVLPPRRMLEILAGKSHSVRFTPLLIPRADHSFHGREAEVVRRLFEWM